MVGVPCRLLRSGTVRYRDPSQCSSRDALVTPPELRSVILRAAGSYTDGYTDARSSTLVWNTLEFPRFSLRRDGRVVDGGGLENVIGRFGEFANSRVKSARRAR